MILGLGGGLIVIGCILALIVPAISITDDLAQGALLGEDVRRPDVRKVPEHLIQSLATATVMQDFFSPGQIVLWREAPGSTGIGYQLLCWGSNTEKRPPPYRSS